MTPRNPCPGPPCRFQPLWLAAGWLLVLLVIYLSLVPSPPSLSKNLSDKLQHVLAYAILMSWFVNIYTQRASRIKIAVGLIALGVGLEFVQHWTGYRTFEVADMTAGAVGVTVGWLSAPPRLPNYLRAIEQYFSRSPPKRRNRSSP